MRLGRVVFEEDSPEIGGEETHVFLELGDHLGSTSVVIDKATSELVERSTTYAYGATESDYRPERWNFFREDYRFTGKEEDVEVGLQYFGKRFYAPMLQRWVSADPLTIHGLGADLNVYAYVSGRALQAVDPLGLDWDDYALGLWDEGVESISGAATSMYQSAKADAEAIKAGTKSWTDVAKEQGKEIVKAAAGVKLVEGGVGLVKRVAELPGDVTAAVTAKSDYEAGRKALKPVATAMEVAAAAGGVRGVVAKQAKPPRAAPSLADELAALEKRVAEIHAELDPIAQTRRTTAVLSGTAETGEGVRVLAGGKRDLTPAQRAQAQPGEVTAKAPGKHAEPTAMGHADSNAIQKRAMVASRKFCDGCVAEIEASGGQVVGDRAAVWPAPPAAQKAPEKK